MITDAELLRQYSEDSSEGAFGELVHRHLDLVHSAALRQVNGDAHLAEDVTQRVFTDLAKKAGSLAHRAGLDGWLYTSTRFAAANAVREERRRLVRENEAYQMSNPPSSHLTPDADWNRLWPVIDEAMHELDEKDREIVLLRFFEKVSLAGVGERLGLSANAAAKRVERALEKLRARLAKRRITSTSAALALILSDKAILAAPAGLGTAVTVAVLCSAAKAGGGAAGIIQIMSTKAALNTAAAIGIAGILGIGSVGTAVYEMRASRRAQAALAAARHEYQAEQGRLVELENSAKAADARVVEIGRDLDRTRAAAARFQITGSTATSSGSKRDPKIDGRNFLATFGQARSMLMEVGRHSIAEEYAAFYRSAGLTPEQIAQFESETVALRSSTVVVTANSMHPGTLQLPDDQLRQVLGNQAFGQFQEFSRTAPAQDVTDDVARVAAYSAEPLSADQVSQFRQIVAQNSSSYKRGGDVDIDGVDWNAAETQARGLLTPSQWQAAGEVFLKQQLAQAVYQAEPSSTPAGDPQPAGE